MVKTLEQWEVAPMSGFRKGFLLLVVFIFSGRALAGLTFATQDDLVARCSRFMSSIVGSRIEGRSGYLKSADNVTFVNEASKAVAIRFKGDGRHYFLESPFPQTIRLMEPAIQADFSRYLSDWGDEAGVFMALSLPESIKSLGFSLDPTYYLIWREGERRPAGLIRFWIGPGGRDGDYDYDTLFVLQVYAFDRADGLKRVKEVVRKWRTVG